MTREYLIRLSGNHIFYTIDSGKVYRSVVLSAHLDRVSQIVLLKHD